MQKLCDVIVIGGGPAGVHAAYPLVEAGLHVLMIDGGVISPHDLGEELQEDFESVRRHREDQHDLFLGRTVSDLPFGKGVSHVRSMTSGNRSYLSDNVDAILPLETEGVQVIQTLAQGGFSEAWSGVCDLYDKEELDAVGIPSDDMPAHYQKIIDRIGVSGTLPGYHTQPPAAIDDRATRVLERYHRKGVPTDSNLSIEPSILAALTLPKDGRQPLAYRDLDFVANPGKAIYRARYSLEELKKQSNFSYVPHMAVERIVRGSPRHRVEAVSFTETKHAYEAPYVVVAAGAPNTVRILLRSFSLYDTPVPFITKTHVVIPCFEWGTVGLLDDAKKHSLTQLVVHDHTKYKGLNKSFSQMLNYKSLLLFRLLPFSPLAAPESFSLLQAFAPSLVGVDVRFPAFENAESYVSLKKEGHLLIHATEAAVPQKKEMLANMRRLFRRVGLLPLRTLDQPFGSTAHYAGGVPEGGKEFPLGTNVNGSLIQDERIYVADASSWRALPAKPPTLTIMANANRVGMNLLKKLRGSY